MLRKLLALAVTAGVAARLFKKFKRLPTPGKAGAVRRQDAPAGPSRQ